MALMGSRGITTGATSTWTSLSKPNSKHLFLTLDALDTLFTPKQRVPHVYAQYGAKYGINCGDPEDPKTQESVGHSFIKAFKSQCQRSPLYGRPHCNNDFQWWTSVIHNTFSPWHTDDSNECIPDVLVKNVWEHFSSAENYTLFPDVMPLMKRLRTAKSKPGSFSGYQTVTVGIISNFDARLPGLLTGLGLEVGPYRAWHGMNREEREEVDRGDTTKPALQNPTTPNQANKSDPDPPENPYDFDFVILSSDALQEKPSAGIFSLARNCALHVCEERKQASKKEQCADREIDYVHVGNDVKKDAHAAKRAGWRGVHLAREAEARPEADDGGVESIASLEELEDLLGDKMD
ncbi:hypothetical protein IAQ61_002856 [Plenodomus lingam]|uniref:Haloacid dehalogenase-like hydrolase n=1 Tax=Leptosphaeria maculans (strain JN3 / isolate v23.1.3 / race Av1-4-5-6-7-8) TaxID=985895 RepID=E5A8H7_LEPMJ|nr:hypothetical protein LEMA_P075110.1 [Plenodomus lingam JN3]KAH9877489.1 hypothetical protein IAQ61_002856 [Plenodomus lingam]CBX99922.1 hypothetical protein LEMA_P075110.1 [Plenodomus lingam JN3]